jgi:hypothetical protein
MNDPAKLRNHSAANMQHPARKGSKNKAAKPQRTGRKETNITTLKPNATSSTNNHYRNEIVVYLKVRILKVRINGKWKLFPSKIAYDGSQTVWGNDVKPTHEHRIENLRTLLECQNNSAIAGQARAQLNALSRSLSAIDIISEYLRFALAYLKNTSMLDGVIKHTFILPSHWKEREVDSYLKAIRKLNIPEESITLLRTLRLK